MRSATLNKETCKRRHFYAVFTFNAILVAKASWSRLETQKLAFVKARKSKSI